jgi:hypothetical protein
MSVHEIAVRGLLHSLCRGTYPPDLDAEWDAATETFKPVMHVPQADGSWRTINVDWLRSDPNTTQPCAEHAQN